MQEDGSAEMQEDEILACAFGSWYERFRREKVTFKSKILPLSEDVVEFLLADGIQVPGDHRPRDDSSSDSSWEEARGNNSSDGEDCADAAAVAGFPALEAQVRETIERFGGGVLPKLNWSAPKDAQWVHGTLQCSTPQEVFTLLKASDFVSHDLCNSFDHCAPGARRRPDEFTLVLRKWYDLRESGEFRCFVQNSTLIAVSQRETTGFFEHLTDREEVEAISEAIHEFFEAHVRTGFPLSRHAFDVYVGPAPRRRVWLVDFSPWGPTTEPCLFDWDELSEIPCPDETEAEARRPPEQGRRPFELRVVGSEAECRTSKLSKFHGLPVELAQLGMGEGLDELLAKADRVLEQKGAT